MSSRTSHLVSAGEGVHAPFGGRLGAGDSAGLHAFLSLDAETDQGADGRAELDRLVLGQVAQVLDFELAVRVLVDRDRVDHPDGVTLAQALELLDDLAVELGMLEPQDDELNRSNCHLNPPYSLEGDASCAPRRIVARGRVLDIIPKG